MTDSSADRDPLDRLAEEFVARLRRGEHPAIDDYAARHPELAEQVRELFPALVEVEQLKDATVVRDPNAGPGLVAEDPTRVGEFRVLRQIGKGGMGVVYEAVQESLGRHVALKLLPAEAVADPQRLERFRREARAAARLHHTNIVPVFGVGEADGRHYYAMQFIPGHPLDAVVAEVRRLKEKSALLPAAPRAVSEIAGALVTGTFAHSAPADHSPDVAPPSATSSPALSGTASGGSGYWATVARIGAQVADALAYAHGQGVLHRDVKPANLLLDPTGTVWVTDFGLAKSADADDLTHAGDIVGTLRYMAPERFDGAGDHRADVYALGLTLYELLTLRPAFSSENRAKLVQEVTAANPPRPRAVNPTIPRDLETIVLKATARDAGARYQTAAALADDLRRYLDGRTITARRVGSAERLWRWAKRAPAVAALLVLTGVLLAAGTAVSVFFAVKADGERTTALAREKDADDARKDANTRADELKAEQEATAALLYASESQQASTAANEYRTVRLLELLEGTRPKPGKPDLRGWEWHYLHRLAQPWETERKLDTAGVPGFAAGRLEAGRCIGFCGGVGLTTGAAFTADGSRLIVPPYGWTDGRTLGTAPPRPVPGGVFDARTGQAVRPVRAVGAASVHYGGVFGDHAAAGWVSPDGRYLAHAEPLPGPAPAPATPPAPPTGFRVKVIDLETGEPAAPPLDLPLQPFAVAVGPGAVRVVALIDPRPVVSFLDPSGNPTPAPPPGSAISLLAVVWERSSGFATRILPHPNPARKLAPHSGGWALSPDGSTAVVIYSEPGPPSGLPGGNPGAAVLQVHDLAGPAGPPRVFDSAVVFNRPVFSAGGTALVVWEGNDGRTVRTFDVRAGRAVGRWTIPREVPLAFDSVAGLLSPPAVSDDGKRVVADTGGGLLVVGEQTRAEPPPLHGRGEWWRTAVVRRAVEPNTHSVLFPRLWLAGDGSRVTCLATDGTVCSRGLTPFPGFDTTWPDALTVDGTVCQPTADKRGRWVVYAPFGRGFGGVPSAATQPVARYDPAAGRLVGTVRVPGELSGDFSVSPDGRRLLAFVTPVLVGPPLPGGLPTPQAHQLVALDRPKAAPLLTRPAPEGGFTGLAEMSSLSEGGRWVLEPEFDRRPEPPSGPQLHEPPDRYRRWAAETRRPAPGLPPGPRDWDGMSHTVPLHSPDDRLVLVQTYPKAASTHPDRPSPVPVTVRCYDAETGRAAWTWAVPEPTPWTRFNPSAAYQPALPRLHFSPDGRWVAAAWVAEGGTLRVRLAGAGTGEDFGELTAAPAEGGPTEARPAGTIAFGPGRWLMVGDGRDAVVWDGPERPGVRLRGHDSGVVAGVFSADGRRLFTLEGAGSARRLIHVWDLSTRREVLTIREALAGVGGGFGDDGRGSLWLDGDRLKLVTEGGVLVFDGTPQAPR